VENHVTGALEQASAKPQNERHRKEIGIDAPRGTHLSTS
jgi:hypothetical protein